MASLSCRGVSLLEQQLQPKLDLAAGVGRCRDNARRAKSGCGSLIGECALGWAGGVDDFVWQLQVGVVQDVEELSAELQTCPLGELCGFKQGEVPVYVAGAYEAVAACIAYVACGGSGVGVRIEELRDAYGCISRGIERTFEVRV